ncbi:MAG: hypothetical protein NTV59_07155 [Chloroflexi bacterium]|nr:hypothetical protein [Chloroflexota bacterium]
MSNWIWILVLIVAYFSLYITALNFVVSRKKQRLTERENKLYKALVEGLKTGAITTTDDVVNIYKGVAGISSEDLSYRYGLSNHLRKFLVALVSKDKNLIESGLADELIRDWKQRISEFIQKNEMVSPYADLPAPERNVLTDISTFLEKNDIESIKRKALELAGMIQARNNDLNRIRNINRWTVPLAIIGLVLTITFGILALLG